MEIIVQAVCSKVWDFLNTKSFERIHRKRMFSSSMSVSKNWAFVILIAMIRDIVIVCLSYLAVSA